MRPLLPGALLAVFCLLAAPARAQNAGAQAYFAKGSRLDPLVSQVRKLIEPRENALLKRIVADKELENVALKEIAKGNW